MDASIADNDGARPCELKIADDGPPAIFTDFPVKKIAESLRGQGKKAKVSYSAGVFVCNSLYYNIMQHIRKSRLRITPLFVHLPVSTDIVSYDEMAEILKFIIDHRTLAHDSRF